MAEERLADTSCVGCHGKHDVAAVKQPAFAFNNANEIPVELDQRNNEFKVGTEYVNAGSRPIGRAWPEPGTTAHPPDL